MYGSMFERQLILMRIMGAVMVSGCVATELQLGKELVCQATSGEVVRLLAGCRVSTGMGMVHNAMQSGVHQLQQKNKTKQNKNTGNYKLQKRIKACDWTCPYGGQKCVTGRRCPRVTWKNRCGFQIFKIK